MNPSEPSSLPAAPKRAFPEDGADTDAPRPGTQQLSGPPAEDTPPEAAAPRRPAPALPAGPDDSRSDPTPTAPRGKPAGPASPLDDADAERRRGLRRMRMVATSLLVLAAVVYVVTLILISRGVGGALTWVNAASEAAMVGALADWFAVTALFRHPLGIPIPHTALIKRRKNDLGRSLQDFVTKNFLTEEIFRERLASAQMAHRISQWLADPKHRNRVMTEAARVATLLLGRMRDDDIRSAVEDALLPRLEKEPFSPIAGAFLEGIVADRAHHKLVDLLANELHDWFKANPQKFTDMVSTKAPKWSPSWVDRRVVNWGYSQALDWFVEVRDTPNHPARRAVDDLLARLARDLQHDPSVMERAEGLKERLLDHPQIGVTVVSLWTSLRNSLLAAIEDRNSSLWVRGDSWLAELGEKLDSDDDLRDRVDSWISDAVAFGINSYGERATAVISYTVERWDADEASDRIESFVGRDLQFIRINGTVVGALAGLVIHAISLLVV